MAILNLLATDRPVPPDRVGDTHIIIKIGTTVVITQSLLMSLSSPKYYQKDDKPMGSIRFTNYGANSNNILRASGTPIIASIKNNGTIVRLNPTNGSWTAQEVTRANFVGNKLTVTGNSVGSDFVTFVCTAYNTPSNNESEYSKDEGVLNIKVVPNVNNPPSIVGNNTIDFEIDVPIVLTGDDFTYGTTPPYADPQNDKPLSVKILTLPTLGTLVCNGVAVTVGQIITYNELNSGVLKYHDHGLASVGQIVPFTFEVSDEGTGIFKA